MIRYFEARGIIKCDKGKGNKNVIGFELKKCFSFGAFEN